MQGPPARGLGIAHNRRVLRVPSGPTNIRDFLLEKKEKKGPPPNVIYVFEGNKLPVSGRVVWG